MTNDFISFAHARRVTGIQCLGTVSKTVKHKKSIKYGELTYSLYLAPHTTSGYNVCQGSTNECRAFCLNESGVNRMSMNDERINNSRIKKTKLFFENKHFFMGWMITEINAAKRKADKLGFKFSIRLNNTSDINPIDFIYMDKNILEIFPDTIFYDYTKVFDRIRLTKIYPNYDLTFSFSGVNWLMCILALKQGIRVAVVFKNVPKEYKGFKVVDGDEYDMRYKNDTNVIVGLKFKIVRKKLNPKIKFVVQ